MFWAEQHIQNPIPDDASAQINSKSVDQDRRTVCSAAING